MGSDAEPKVVIGQYVADAAAREHQHRSTWTGPDSPLASICYDLDAGEGDLLRFRPAPSDALVASVVERLADAGETERATARGALGMDDFSTLLTFSDRCVVRALRREPNLVLTGLSALTLIDPARLDPRDLLRAVAVCAYALTRVGLPARAALARAGASADKDATGAFTRFVDEPPVLADWGCTEVSTSKGTGIAQNDFARFEPSEDLLEVAIAIADAIDRDDYRVSSVTIASDLPEVWFGRDDRTRLEQTLEAVRASITAHAIMRPARHPDASAQTLVLFLSECATSGDAEWLATRGRESAVVDHCALVVTRRRTLATLIARSVVSGTPAYETTESIRRFSPAIEASLG